MTIVFDSSAWIEMFSGGTNTPTFTSAAIGAEAILVPTVAMFEVYRYCLRHFDETTADNNWAVMFACQVIELSPDLAASAAKLAHAHKLAMADAIILATARENDAELWTQDADFKDLPGVRYFEKASRST